MKKLPLVLLALLAACSSFPSGPPDWSGGGGAATTKPIGCDKVEPACPDGCYAFCDRPMIPDPFKTENGHWECLPLDEHVTPPGVCGAPGPCFENGTPCGQDAYCCSLVCSVEGECEACRHYSEGCSEASQCCSGVCSLNACGEKAPYLIDAGL